MSDYRLLGSRLKRIREQEQETLAEVSGAVEIDVEQLQKYEQGKARPSEDILELLINHFAIREEEAEKLWHLAGYEPNSDTKEESLTSAPVIVLPIDARTIYSDGLNITRNDYGLVLNFTQGNVVNDQTMVVSRLGMSKEQAARVLEQLRRALEPSQPKALPESNQPAAED